MPESVISKIDKESFEHAVSVSKSFSQVLKRLHLKNGGLIKTIMFRVEKENIDTSHFVHFKTIKDVSDEEFEEAIKNSTSFSGVKKLLTVGNNISIRKRAEANNISFSHFLLIDKRLRVDKFSDEEFMKAVKNAKSVHQVVTNLKLKNSRFYEQVTNRIEKQNIDISHFDSHWHNHQLKGNTKEYDTNEVFKYNSGYKNLVLKNVLLKQIKLSNTCAICGLNTHWNDKELVLQLDHINGNNIDNRLENLRLLCPNCHSQTDTFCSKNNTKFTNKCIDCEVSIKTKSKRCHKCHENFRKETKRERATATSKNTCIDCKTTIHKDSTRCISCENKSRTTIKTCIDCNKHIKKTSTRCVECYRLSVKKP